MAAGRHGRCSDQASAREVGRRRHRVREIAPGEEAIDEVTSGARSWAERAGGGRCMLVPPASHTRSREPSGGSKRDMRQAPEALLEFLAAFAPGISKLFLATRRTVLMAAPEANELVYDAYNAVTAAYSFSGRLKEAFCHVAAYSGHVNLGFNRGAELPDPSRLLAG